MLDITAKIDYNDPTLLLPNKRYESGLYPGENTIYKYAYPESDAPVMTLPFEINVDNTKNLKPGYYQVSITKDRKKLVLFQSKEIKAFIDIVKVEKQKEQFDYKDEKLKLQSQAKQYLETRKKKKYLETLKDIELLERQRQLLRSAKIEDSHKGYYVVKYENENIIAIGFIKK